MFSFIFCLFAVAVIVVVDIMVLFRAFFFIILLLVVFVLLFVLVIALLCEQVGLIHSLLIKVFIHLKMVGLHGRNK